MEFSTDEPDTIIAIIDTAIAYSYTLMN